jgi:hypothetical protein
MVDRVWLVHLLQVVGVVEAVQLAELLLQVHRQVEPEELVQQ